LWRELTFHLLNKLVLLGAGKSGACRDETPDDDILLQSDQSVDGTGDGGLGKLARRVLE